MEKRNIDDVAADAAAGASLQYSSLSCTYIRQSKERGTDAFAGRMFNVHCLNQQDKLTDECFVA